MGFLGIGDGGGGNMPWQGGNSGTGFGSLGNDWLSVNVPGMFKDIFNPSGGADAAQNAMEAQLGFAKQTQAQALGIAGQNQKDVMGLAGASPQELNAYGKSLTAASQNLDQQQKLLSAIDPSIMEASKQILGILRGDSSASTPARQAQRAQLVNSLQSQYGPGAETTSVGQHILQQFDMGTLGMRNQDLATNMGVVGMGSGLQGSVQSGIGTLNSAGGDFSNIQNRMLNARMGTGQSTLAALTGTSQNVYNSAGAPYTSQYLQGQGQQQFMHDVFGFGGQVLGGNSGSGGGGRGLSMLAAA